jgi:hypothetical protein
MRQNGEQMITEPISHFLAALWSQRLGTSRQVHGLFSLWLIAAKKNSNHTFSVQPKWLTFRRLRKKNSVVAEFTGTSRIHRARLTDRP